MGKFKRNRSAFTLIELLVVTIIVAVLASVGIPLLSGNIERAKATEAEASLGTIRTGLRAYFAEHGEYPNFTNQAPDTADIGINKDDLLGRFYDTVDYAIDSNATSGIYCIKATGNSTTSRAPKKIEVDDIDRAMNQKGDIFNTAACA